jgi:mRNA interferase RelE/StbE
MPEYLIVFARSAAKEIEKLNEPLSSRILARIESLSSTPRPSGCRKLQATEALWRIRIGDYRVLYAIDDHRQLVDIIAIRHRRDAYD